MNQQGQNKDQNRQGQAQGQMKNQDTDKRASLEFKEHKKEQADQQPRDDQGRFTSKTNK